MISISLPLKKTNWKTISFVSTLYLCPILDLLLARIPCELHDEIRLGLQEALVNAVKHGNKLDPSKRILIQYSFDNKEYSWVISDQGNGFIKDKECCLNLPPEESENGRGVCLLHHIFDEVDWNRQGTQVTLCRRVQSNHDEEVVYS